MKTNYSTPVIKVYKVKINSILQVSNVPVGGNGPTDAKKSSWGFELENDEDKE